MIEKNLVIIGVPVGHFMLPWKFALSLLKAAINLQEQNLKIRFLMLEGSYIDLNKTKILNKALQHNFEYLVMLDWDQTFSPDDLHNLYTTAKDNQLDLLSGLYFVEKGRRVPCLIANNVIYENYPKDQLFQVDTFAAGFSIISYKAAQAIASMGGYDKIEKKGEDVSFCQRAKELGFKVWCDSRIKVGHLRFKEI